MELGAHQLPGTCAGLPPARLRSMFPPRAADGTAPRSCAPPVSLLHPLLNLTRYVRLTRSLDKPVPQGHREGARRPKVPRKSERNPAKPFSGSRTSIARKGGFAMSRGVNANDGYLEALVKNMPSETVGGYLATTGMVSGASPPEALLWVIWGIFLMTHSNASGGLAPETIPVGQCK